VTGSVRRLYKVRESANTCLIGSYVSAQHTDHANRDVCRAKDHIEHMRAGRSTYKVNIPIYRLRFT